MYANGFSGTALSTTYVSSTQLTALVPASLIATAGMNPIIMETPSYTSEINGPGVTVIPVISSLSPPNKTAGGPAFTLTVNGNGFASGAAVDWNGSPLSTTYVSATQLTAAVPASLIANAGTATVTVKVGGGCVYRHDVHHQLPAGHQFIEPVDRHCGRPGVHPNGERKRIRLGGRRELWRLGTVHNYVSATQLTAAVPAT